MNKTESQQLKEALAKIARLEDQLKRQTDNSIKLGGELLKVLSQKNKLQDALNGSLDLFRAALKES